jgi:hypothetical protein
MKTKIRNYASIALFLAFSFFANVVLANEGNGDKPAAELKYVGNVKNQAVFQLDLSSPNEEYFYISIKDQSGDVLYNEKVKTKAFSRRFVLDNDYLNEAVVRIEVRNGNAKREVFTINRNTRFYEETNISKL